jgi:hypothetical protein
MVLGDVLIGSSAVCDQTCVLFVQVFVIKEGVSYRIRIDFIVQREIVHGLRYVQKTYRMGMPGKKVPLTDSCVQRIYQILFGGNERVWLLGFKFKMQ